MSRANSVFLFAWIVAAVLAAAPAVIGTQGYEKYARIIRAEPS